MVISYTAEGNVAAKLKAATFSLGATVKIDAFELPGAGEYDVSSVHAEVTNLEESTAYWLHVEELHICFLSALDASVTKQDEAAATDILVVNLNSSDAPDKLKPIIKAMEPGFVFLIGAGATSEAYTALGLPTQEGGTLKVLKASLPEEGTIVVLPA